MGELYRWREQDLIDRGQADGAGSQASAEPTGAKKRIRDLEEEAEILRGAAAAVGEVVPAGVRFRLVAQLRVDGVRIGRSCHALGVSRSGCDERACRAPSARSIRSRLETRAVATIALMRHGHRLTRCRLASGS
ncbi:hypothetical protein [Kineococcus indalonis]|uniref:hypothetical protein n=1 Tax=Kineococcus indalonis TaxID=2696566 RepID=UPI001F10928A|nr:hypothetical protein [Kineococcus indalonis]